MPIRRAEELIATLPGIISVRIVPNETGAVEEIHVLTTDLVAPKNTVRNIESALMAQLGIRVNHRKISIATTLDGLRPRVGTARILAVLEPRSNTMKLGVHRDTLAPALSAADRVWFHRPADLGWDLEAAAASLGTKAETVGEIDALVARLAAEARDGDHVLVMSNGGFGGLHGKLLAALGRG